MLSPVAGLRPWRAARLRVANVPKPAIETVSPRASASPMVANTAPTTLSAVALVAEIRVATLDANSVLFMRHPLGVRWYIRAGCRSASGCRDCQSSAQPRQCKHCTAAARSNVREARNRRRALRMKLHLWLRTASQQHVVFA